VSWKCTASAGIGTRRAPPRSIARAFAGVPTPIGVAERDFVAAGRCMRFATRTTSRHRHLALVRAAEHGRHVAAHAHAVGARALEHRREALEALVDRRR
jgi:hypothetical protein